MVATRATIIAPTSRITAVGIIPITTAGTMAAGTTVVTTAVGTTAVTMVAADALGW